MSKRNGVCGIVQWVLLLCVAGAVEAIEPMDIRFHRQAVRRLVFDRDQAIPLSRLNPSELVQLSLQHPEVALAATRVDYRVEHGHLRVGAAKASESARWIGGVNPYGTYEIAFAKCIGSAAQSGIELATSDNQTRLQVLAGFEAGVCNTIHYRIQVDGEELQAEGIPLEQPVKGPFVLRVQSLGAWLNLFIEQDGVTRSIGGSRRISEMIDLRRTDIFRDLEFRLFSRLEANTELWIREAGSCLSTGIGQADLCAITYKDGSPMLDQGRLWFTISVRGQYAGQGVFSVNPSVFDIRYEGLIVFDRGDGVLRNEIASHIYFDREADEWRGLTVGFSSKGDPVKGPGKQLWAVSSKKDPRFGFSVMKAKTVDMPGAGEDPHIIYDAAAKKWRVLACAAMKSWSATLYESDHWDGPYTVIAGPVKVDSTGCLLQKIDGTYYAMFGGKSRAFSVYSYPGLKKLGVLDMSRPPWTEDSNARCWPNVIPLPQGYPAPYVALTMDRANFTEEIGWSYGALYFYHGYVKE